MMRKIIYILVIVLGVFSCENQPKDYVTLTGKITNFSADDTLKISKGKFYQKLISINEDGTFSDTLKVLEGDYRFSYGDDYGLIYLKNNNVSSLTFDHKDFYNTLVYGGDDSDINNFAVQNYQLINKHFSADMTYNATREDIDTAIYNFKAEYEKLKLRFKNVDSLHIANADNGLNRTIESVKSLYASKLALQNALPKGHPSPVFENYENYDGGTTSLSDFKGKYVYLVFWTSWNTVSKKDFPVLEQLKSQYKGKNIAFVSISLDDARGSVSNENALELWKKTVDDEKLGGIQLFADNGWKSDFVVDYQIKGIPRFILIDPEGNIISPDAPSPSNPKLNELLDSLNL
jgi:thiol-disulfide isomerase/thioredoxin